MELRGVIFDADGTLLDSMYIWDTIGADYLRSLGITPRENLAETFRSMSLEQAAHYYQTHYGVTLSTAEILRGIDDMIAGYYRETIRLKPGASALVKGFWARGVRMCIATATSRELIEAALRREGILHCFSALFTCEEVGTGKDSACIYEAALAHLATPKAQTLVFEDALHALTTAHHAVFPTAAVFDSSEPRQDALRSLADFYFENLHQAAKLLEYVPPASR